MFCNDRATGLKAIVAIHSTALGPALGGTRFFPYASTNEAIVDVLNLARGMSYKNALAGLDLGGGKAVIIGDPATLKTEALLRAYGRFVQSLNGRYYTACDVGTFSVDMDVVARECGYVTGRTVAHGGAGDSSILTAFGVFQGMRAAAERVWGAATLRGRRVGVEGVGKVGYRLIEHLRRGRRRGRDHRRRRGRGRPGPRRPSRGRRRGRARRPGRRRHRRLRPCALGGALGDVTVAALRAKVVCGAANNQLAHPGIEKQLADRGVLYAPDYVVNSGGVIRSPTRSGASTSNGPNRRRAGSSRRPAGSSRSARTRACRPRLRRIDSRNAG